MLCCSCFRLFKFDLIW